MLSYADHALTWTQVRVAEADVIWSWKTGALWENVTGTPGPSDYPPESARAGTVLPTSGEEIPNSGRGQYEWLEIPLDPSHWPASGDEYLRDQLRWPALQPTPTTFDLSLIDMYLTQIANAGGRAGIRIMPWLASASDQSWITPTWIPRQSGSTAPDWNHPTFINGWVNLWEQIAAAFGSGRAGGPDPRIFYIDFGGLGDCGEMGTFGPAPPSRANAVTVMQAVADAFPTVPKAANWYASPYPGEGWPEVAASIVTNGTLSLRNDAIGGFQQSLAATDPLVSESWKTAPTVTEFAFNVPTEWTTYLGYAQESADSFHVSLMSSGNKPFTWPQLTTTQQGLFAALLKSAGFRLAVTQVISTDQTTLRGPIHVQASIVNSGNSPLYDETTVSAVLINGSGGRWSFPLGGDLRASLGSGSVTNHSGAVYLPQSIGTGTYTLAIEVKRDRASYLEPIRLANTGRDTAGAYPFGTVTVV